jgi:hypothetical protein
VEETSVKRKGRARTRDEQHGQRERRGEDAFLFGPDEECLGKIEREDWDFAIAMTGGNVVEGARLLGLDVPRGTRALWGRSPEEAIGAYRSWLKRARKRHGGGAR